MARQRSVLVFTLFVLPCLLTAGSPVPSEFGFSSSEQEDMLCEGDWHRFRHLCWTIVPQALTLLTDDVMSGDLYCSQLGAQAFHLAGRLYCVKEAVRLSDDLELGNLFPSDGEVMSKRLMGNNGY